LVIVSFPKRQELASRIFSAAAFSRFDNPNIVARAVAITAVSVLSAATHAVAVDASRAMGVIQRNQTLNGRAGTNLGKSAMRATPIASGAACSIGVPRGVSA
jgi:hypothetical protein